MLLNLAAQLRQREICHRQHAAAQNQVLRIENVHLGGDQLRNVLDLREKMTHFMLTDGPWAHPETNPRVHPDFRAAEGAADYEGAAGGKDGESK